MPVLTREELYDLVWTDPVRTVAGRFGVSDVWVKKVCLRADVPVPERGYWAKLQAGKPVVKAKLPLREPGQSDRIVVGAQVSSSWRWDPEAELAEPLPSAPTFPEPMEAVAARVAKRVGKVRNIRHLAQPCGQVRKLLDQDERRREEQRKSSYAFLWDAPLFESPFERRRLRLLNSLCFGLAGAGAKLQIRGKEGRELTADVADQFVALTLDHPSARPDVHGRHKTRAGPSDTLRMQIGSAPEAEAYRAVWQDDEVKLESQLTEIVCAIVVAAEAQHRADRLRHHAYLLQRRIENEAEVERRRLEAETKARERRQAEEKARRDLLFGQAHAWRTANDIRGFVADVLTCPSHEQFHDLQAWAKWALAEADAIDPVRGGSLVAVHAPDDDPSRR
jgi:hypothetical protein